MDAARLLHLSADHGGPASGLGNDGNRIFAKPVELDSRCCRGSHF